MTLAISLFVTACLAGSLHGAPKELCREFHIRSYDTIEACEKAHDKAVEEWVRGLEPYGLSVRVRAVRCGPAEAEEGDDI